MANFYVWDATKAQSAGQAYVVFNVADAAAAKARAEVLAKQVAGAFGAWSTRALGNADDDFMFHGGHVGAVFKGQLDRGGTPQNW